MIGIHSPEFAWEKDRNQMREVMRKYSIQYPQVLDDDFKYWNALGNRYWPSFYVVDKQGKIQGRFFGETHDGDDQSKKIHSMIESLTAEN